MDTRTVYTRRRERVLRKIVTSPITVGTDIERAYAAVHTDLLTKRIYFENALGQIVLNRGWRALKYFFILM